MSGAYTYTPYVVQGVDKEIFKIYPNISEKREEIHICYKLRIKKLNRVRFN